LSPISYVVRTVSSFLLSILPDVDMRKTHFGFLADSLSRRRTAPNSKPLRELSSSGTHTSSNEAHDDDEGVAVDADGNFIGVAGLGVDPLEEPVGGLPFDPSLLAQFFGNDDGAEGFRPQDGLPFNPSLLAQL